MDRRTFLARTTVLAAVGLAGCTSTGTGDESDGDGGGDDGGEWSTDSGNGSGGSGQTITDRTFERTGECDQPSSATVTRDGDTVVVEGCIRGRNGCSVAVLDSVQYDAAEDRLSVVVATNVEREDDEVCTQALVSRGYEVRVEFENGLPGNVDVIHDGADGRSTVASSNATE
ncbi:hypothetical protein [Haloprofundus salilacus]|uniref:hypothetical protein n=1 Tax=Haloprofundus salilacus TaxID=2876190 RepID=UPI001CCA270D|nr:hypothetical protein [Haloprofundus salilacus]